MTVAPKPDKPYRSVPIRECGEPMALIPQGVFTLVEPHPYVAAGAPYGKVSPWTLRKSIVDSLRNAQTNLSKLRPGWNIQLFDAYRPNAVQAYMVELEFAAQAKKQGLDPKALSESERDSLSGKVFRLWGIPSDDPAMPPPHSTGAAFDCTLIDEAGREVDMGSPIDENSPRSLPDAFAAAADDAGKQAHANRVFLHELMRAEGFVRNVSEWWHFSRGDQLAVWIEREKKPQAFAIYGRATL
jgi:D-alanyl-D-alanine dipeptidase